MSKIWGIILAAGESKRMGRQKLLLPFQEKTIIIRSIDNVLHSRVEHILVVLGSHCDEVFDLIRHLAVKFCYNANYKKGMLSSVKCGIRALPDNCEAVLVFPGDQPMIAPEAIDAVIETYRNSGKGIVIPTYKNRRGHPILIDCKYLKEIQDIEDWEGLRALQLKFAEDVLEVETTCSGILKDIDTKEEYQEVLEYFIQKGIEKTKVHSPFKENS